MKAFTLIEIMIAVILALVISGVAFKISSQAKYFLLLNKKRTGFYYKASVGALEKESANVYEMLKNFKIKNDNIIENLKKDKLNKKVTVEYNMNQKINNTKLDIMVKDIKIFNRHNSLILYSPDVK